MSRGKKYDVFSNQGRSRRYWDLCFVAVVGV